VQLVIFLSQKYFVFSSKYLFLTKNIFICSK
jgi:hypothetical protein